MGCGGECSTCPFAEIEKQMKEEMEKKKKQKKGEE